MKQPSPASASRLRLSYRLLEQFAAWLPARAACALAQLAADRRWSVNRPLRRTIAANLSRLLGTPVREDDPMGREVCRNFSRSLLEFFAFQRAHPALAIEGQVHLERCRALGTILLTGHLGNWEVGAALIRRMGIAVTVVAQGHEDPQIDAMFVRQRRRCGLGVVPRGERAAQASLQQLRQGAWLGVLGDWDLTGDGLRVCFGAGRLAVPRGPAVLSLRTGAPVLPAVLIREGPWAFRLFVEEPIWPAREASIERAVESLSRRYAEVLARYACRFPAQWLMFHDAIRPQGSGLEAVGLGARASSPEPGALSALR